MDLDAPGGFSAVDPRDALADLEATPGMWAAARDLATVRLDLRDVEAVVVVGMGGSGIAGDVAAAVAEDVLGVPLLVRKGYGVPAFVGPRTLVVACSYSGGTEETLAAVDLAAAQGSRLFGVTSGGPLAARLDELGAPVVVVPGGGQPRHSMGYLAVPVLVALGLDDGLGEALEVLAEVVEEGARDVPTARNDAKRLGAALAGGVLPWAWGATPSAVVAAYRFKCQLNENAKLPASATALPELDHNEVVGFAEPSPLDGRVGLVAFRDPVGESDRLALRVRVTEELVRPRCAWTAAIEARGSSTLARLASLVLQGDLVSLYTALALDRDPTPIGPIDALKSALASAS